MKPPYEYEASVCPNCLKNTDYLPVNELGLCPDCYTDPDALEEFYTKMDAERKEMECRMDMLLEINDYE